MKPFSKTLLMLLALGFCQTANAGLINFESIPDGIPMDGLSIGTQFVEKEGVRFRLAKGTLPVLIQTGISGSGAFVGYDGVVDTLAPGEPDIGNFFLHDDNSTDTTPSDLIIEFSNPVAFFSGQILDMEGRGPNQNPFEAWRVIARDGSGTTLDAFGFNGRDTPLDARAAFFAFDFEMPSIESVIISYTGTVRNPGFAFDNFYVSAAPVPEPGSLALLGLLGTGFAARGRRKDRTA